MNKNIEPDDVSSSIENENTPDNQGMNRRKFVALTATAAAGFTIVPRHVLGGKNFVAPSDKITLAL